jgi:hypothetical protein
MQADLDATEVDLAAACGLSREFREIRMMLEYIRQTKSPWIKCCRCCCSMKQGLRKMMEMKGKERSPLRLLQGEDSQTEKGSIRTKMQDPQRRTSNATPMVEKVPKRQFVPQ